VPGTMRVTHAIMSDYYSHLVSLFEDDMLLFLDVLIFFSWGCVHTYLMFYGPVLLNIFFNPMKIYFCYVFML
jgi:hypothetical protein